MSFLRDSGGAVVLQGLAAVLQFAALVLIARDDLGLGAGGRGVYALVVLIPNFARALIHLGFGTASTRLVAKDPSRSGVVAANALIFAGLVSAGCVTLGLLAFEQLQEFVQPEGAPEELLVGLNTAVLLALGIIPMLLIEAYVGGLLTGLRAIIAANLCKVIQTGCFVVFLPIGFLVVGRNVTAALWAMLVSFAMSNFMALVSLRMVLQGRFRPDGKLLHEAFVFGLRTFPASVALYLMFRVDLPLLRFLEIPAHEVGAYSVAASLGLMFQILGFAAERALVPRIMSRSAEEATALTPVATRAFVMLAGPAAVVAGLLSIPFVPLIFGEEFRASVLPFCVILPGLVIGNVGFICNTDLIGRGFPGYGSVSAVASLLVNVALNFLLIPKIGILGAAVASFACYAQHGLTLAIVYSRITKVPLRRILFPAADDLFRINKLLGR